jgi:Domain of unknown function (DUF4135)
VNFGDVQTQLATLGVTLTYEDDPAAMKAALQLARQYRASLYLQHLNAARNFLTTTLAGPVPGGLGAGYPFVAQALADPQLLDDLAGNLDHWICPAVEQAMNAALAVPPPNPTTNYTQWFDNDILDPNNVVYAANVTAFFNAYPIADNALTRIRLNFQANIKLACDRIIGDKAEITALFSDRYYGLYLSALTGITSTGSDYHKGGQQVLVLTFATRTFGGYWPLASTLKLIYKPADLELDCLIAGESAAVNRAVGGGVPFMQASLVEIFNTQAANNPGVVEQLPTYRILPRNPTSPYVGVGPVPIRQAYGYIEYLDYSLTGETLSAFNFYPLGASDYLILQSQNEVPIIEKFYRQAGQLLALAVTFSLFDLHIENVRAKTYQPHLIDLEISLTSTTNFVTDTLLLFTLMGTATGGYDGSVRANEDWIYTFVPFLNPPAPPQEHLNQVFLTKVYQNRLYGQRPDRRIVPVCVYYLLQGLQNGMNTLRAAQQAGAFAAWFARLANVLVRVVPLATSDWNQVRQQIYADALALAPPPPPPLALAPTIAEQVRRKLTAMWNAYGVAATPEPKFAALTAPQVPLDLANFDIPTFYHRIGTTDLLDSMGNTIPVPAQITVYNAAIPPAPVVVNTNVGRVTYFAAPPTAARIQNGQVADLTGAPYPGRCLLWRTQVVQYFGLNAVPANPGVLIP